MSLSPVNSILDARQQETAGAALLSTLADLVGLSLAAKQAHWTVVGAHFAAVHRQLDELVESARQYSDTVAERAAAIGLPPDGTAKRVVEQSATADFPTGWRSDTDVVNAVTGILHALIVRLRVRIDETDKADPVTQDLLIEITAEMEKAHWMWQAQSPVRQPVLPGGETACTA